MQEGLLKGIEFHNFMGFFSVLEKYEQCLIVPFSASCLPIKRENGKRHQRQLKLRSIHPLCYTGSGETQKTSRCPLQGK